MCESEGKGRLLTTILAIPGNDKSKKIKISLTIADRTSVSSPVCNHFAVVSELISQSVT